MGVKLRAMSERKGFWRRLVSGRGNPNYSSSVSNTEQGVDRGFVVELKRELRQSQENARLLREKAKQGEMQRKIERKLELERVEHERAEQARLERETKLREWQEFYERNIMPVEPMVNRCLSSLAEATWHGNKRKSKIDSPSRVRIGPFDKAVWTAGETPRDRFDYEYYQLDLMLDVQPSHFFRFEKSGDRTNGLEESELKDLVKREFLRGPSKRPPPKPPWDGKPPPRDSSWTNRYGGDDLRGTG